MDTSSNELSTQLRKARATALTRLALEHLLGLTAALTLVVPLAVVAVRWTGRGDLGLRWVCGGFVAAIAAATIHLALRAYGRLRNLDLVAREILKAAQHTNSGWTTAQAHALLAAYELAQHGPSPHQSADLSHDYVHMVAGDRQRPPLQQAFPRLRWRRRAALVCAGLLALVTEVVLAPPLREGVSWLLAGSDNRPPPTPRQLWQTLELALDFPPHTGRSSRIVSNPSGTMRLPAGTRVQVRLSTLEDARRVRLDVTGQDIDDPKGTASQPLELLAAGRNEASLWSASFTVRGPGSWMLRLENGERDIPSPPFTLQIETDLAPEVELLPLPAREKVTKTTDRLDLRFRAKDDFGLQRADLVYRLPDGAENRLPIALDRAGKQAELKYTWSLGEIALEARSELEYWIEVRDNDPGLGIVPLPDGPGKVGASAHMRLPIDDAELAHSHNLKSLQALRALAVDVLAARLTGSATGRDPIKSAIAARERLQAIRALLATHEQLVTSLAQAVDLFGGDSLAGPRAAKTLAEIHQRLLPLFRSDVALLENVPVGREDRADGARALVVPIVRKLVAKNPQHIDKLEDEIIRLDDLVDGQLLAQLEALVARVTAGQARLVELLAQLKAGDESVRPALEQVQQRLALDMRKLNEARRALSKELGQEYLNQDAFRVLEARMRHLALAQRLRDGDVDGALKDAQETLDHMRKLQQEVQDRMAQDGEQAELSPEERARAELLRELTRLLEDQKTAHEQSNVLHGQWEKLANEAPSTTTKSPQNRAAQALESLEKINDATLGRDARSALEDAKDALKRLRSDEQAPETSKAIALNRYREAVRAAESLRASLHGADATERQTKTIEHVQRQLSGLVEELEKTLPSPLDKLDAPSQSTLRDVTTRQGALRDRSAWVTKQPFAEVLPPSGKTAMQRAEKAMQESRQELGEGSLEVARLRQKGAIARVEEAIASLRDSPPPPPPSQTPPTDSSMQAEQDKSLRQRIMEVMREGKPGEKGPEVERYYEEMLR